MREAPIVNANATPHDIELRHPNTEGMYALVSDQSRRILFLNAEDQFVSSQQITMVCRYQHESSVQWLDHTDGIDRAAPFFFRVGYDQKPFRSEFENAGEQKLHEETHRLISGKFRLMKTLHFRVNGVRKRLIPREIFQDEVYRLKIEEAKAFQRNPSDSSAGEKYALLQDYAQLMNVSLQVASEDILMRAQETYEILRNTEKLRQKYLLAISRSADLSDLQKVESDYRLEAVDNVFI